MWNKLAHLERRYQELTQLISEPEIIAQQNKWQKYMKEQAQLEEIVQLYREYRDLEAEIKENEGLLTAEVEAEFLELVNQELTELKAKQAVLLEELKILLIPEDPRDEKNVILEIRSGTGGEEAALFAADLLKMYTRYAEKRGWQVEMLAASYTDHGGFKEVIVLIKGQGAYSCFKFESGVHRVQRVPVTEAGGRIHTSAATVAVLPEAAEVDVEISPQEIRVDLFVLVDLATVGTAPNQW